MRLATALGAALLAGAALAQAPAIERRILERTPLAGENRDVLLVKVTIPAGASAGRHSHPGIETGYVLEGEAVLEVEGEAPRALKAGDTYLVPAGRIHDARAAARAPATVIATFVVERGRPLATPAP